MRIDAHQHFWKFDPVRDSWITPEMQKIRRDFLPTDLHPLLQGKSFDGCVAVQADQSENETDFLIQLANSNVFVKGVVGWVDFKSDKLSERLSHYSRVDIVKGFRHVVQGEPDGFLLQSDFINGVRQLGKCDFTYDLLIYPHQLKEAIAFIRQLPDQPIVIDHLAKPYIKRKEISDWKRDMTSIASLENAWCKVSGLVTEANWSHWSNQDFRPYLETVLDLFGPNRLMFGSDWPVCLVAASYSHVVDLVDDFFSVAVSQAEKQKIMGENAVRFYNL